MHNDSIECIYMKDIVDFFTELIEQSKSLDIAEAEFKRMLHDDCQLKEAYSEWCQQEGTTERRGFREFCEQYMESQDDIWNQLRDYDEQE